MSRQNSPVKIAMDAKGRRMDKMRLPLITKAQRKPHLLLGALAAFFLVVAIAVGISIYQEGETAQRNAENLLLQYDGAVSQSPAATPGSAATPLPQGTPAGPTAAALPPGDGYVQPDSPEVDPKDAMISLPGYEVIGKLSIEKIGLELPVISEMNTKALKVSICYFQGALPGEKGNMIITGHNYANGAHFGKLDKLKTGDGVLFTAPDGQVYRYAVDETQVVTPDNLSALDKYEGDYALTLLTCASSGNRRLLVRCSLSPD